jgi:hypothetical protein
MQMAVRLSEKDMMALERLFVDAKGRGFKPASMRAALIARALKAGWVRKADGDFFYHRDRASHLIFTDSGKTNLLKRMADRHAMDMDDAHHLVRTGSFHMVETAVRRPSKGDPDSGVQTGF